MDTIQKVPSRFIESGKDLAKLLELTDAALDEVTFFVKMAVILALDDAIGFRGNHREDGLLTQPIQYGIRVIGFVHDGIDGRLAGRQCRGLSHIGDLAGSGDEPQGIAQGIDQDMNFAAEPTPRTADGLIRWVGKARNGPRRARMGPHHRAIEHDALSHLL